MNLGLACPKATHLQLFNHKIVCLHIVCLFGNINTLLVSERAGNKSSIPTNESPCTIRKLTYSDPLIINLQSFDKSLLFEGP